MRAPLIVSWQKGLPARGEIRSQFHHVIDIVPTLLDLAGVAAPAVHSGVRAAADPRREPALLVRRRRGADRIGTTQYFEMFTHRAIWHDGWKAVSFHRRGNTHDQDSWELYHLDDDFSECNDLAARSPKRLQEMISLWWAEARRFGVLPLDDRGFPERAVKYQTPGSPRLRSRLVLYPGMARIPSGAAPLMINRSFRIVGRLGRPARRARGRHRLARRPERRLHAVREARPARCSNTTTKERRTASRARPAR